jgi:hypothetical protein
MPITFRCPICNAVFTVADELTGKRGRCSKCGTELTIPTQSRTTVPSEKAPIGRPSVKGAEGGAQTQVVDPSSPPGPQVRTGRSRITYSLLAAGILIFIVSRALRIPATASFVAIILDAVITAIIWFVVLALIALIPAARRPKAMWLPAFAWLLLAAAFFDAAVGTYARFVVAPNVNALIARVNDDTNLASAEPETSAPGSPTAAAETVSQSPKERLAIQAKQNADAMLKKDYETAVHFMYPPVLEEMGGFHKTLAFVKASMAEMESEGWAIETITVAEPSAIVIEGREDVAIVPIEMVMRIEEKNVLSNSYLVAISQNRGRTWYFFDGAQMPREKLAQMYPKLVATVQIPERKNTLVDEINETLNKIQEKEGKPIQEILDERLAEAARTISKIEDNGLRPYIERREGRKLEQIPVVRLNELLKELKIE